MLDAFHVTRLGFTAVDLVRRRIQQEQTGHRGRRDDPLFRIRRLLRRRTPQPPLVGSAAGRPRRRRHPDEQLARTWVAAQDLRLVFHAADRARAEQALSGG